MNERYGKRGYEDQMRLLPCQQKRQTDSLTVLMYVSAWAGQWDWQLWNSRSELFWFCINRIEKWGWTADEIARTLCFVRQKAVCITLGKGCCANISNVAVYFSARQSVYTCLRDLIGVFLGSGLLTIFGVLLFQDIYHENIMPIAISIKCLASLAFMHKSLFFIRFHCPLIKRKTCRDTRCKLSALKAYDNINNSEAVPLPFPHTVFSPMSMMHWADRFL